MNYAAFLSATKRTIKNIGYGDRLNPVRDWLVLLGSTAFLLAFVFIWNITVFFTTVGSETAAVSEIKADAANTAPVDELRSRINQRTAASEAADVAHPFVDPSSEEK